MPRPTKSWCGGVLDWRSGELAAGLACYRRQEFFEAHEHWELVWLDLDEPEKSFLQAIIQITAAFHHWQRGEADGTLSLLRRVRERLKACPDAFGGLAVEPLRVEVDGWLCGIEGGDSPPAFPAVVPLVNTPPLF
jgi:predicted metal-dependent hydrolase